MPSFLVLLSTLQISLRNWRLDVGDGKTVEHLERSREKLRHERNAYLEQVCLIYVHSPEELYILHPLAFKNPVLMPIQLILICLLGLYSCYFQHVAFLCDWMKWTKARQILGLGGASGSLSNLEMIPRI
jgi:hypothetical protein